MRKYVAGIYSAMNDAREFSWLGSEYDEFRLISVFNKPSSAGSFWTWYNLDSNDVYKLVSIDGLEG